MDAQQEMYSLQEIFEVVKQLTGFAGDIMTQSAWESVYKEQLGVDAIMKHIVGGGRADAEMIRLEYADGFEERMKSARVPFAAFEVTMDSGEKQRMYAFRDKDREIIRDLVREISLEDMVDIVRSAPRRDREPELDIGR